MADLEYKQLFGLNAPSLPPAPDFAHIGDGATALMAASPIFKFFGIEVDDQTVSLARNLQAEWASHRSSYTPPPAGTRRSPATVFAYWRGAAKLLPNLSKIACIRRLRRLRPNGNVATELFMSIVKDMDKVKARSTKAKTLYYVAFLRANSPIVRLLLKRGALEMLSASERDGAARDAARQAVKQATLQITPAQLLLAADASASRAAAAAERLGKEGEREKEEEGEGGEEEEEGEREEGEAELSF